MFTPHCSLILGTIRHKYDSIWRISIRVSYEHLGHVFASPFEKVCAISKRSVRCCCVPPVEWVTPPREFVTHTFHQNGEYVDFGDKLSSIAIVNANKWFLVWLDARGVAENKHSRCFHLF